MHKLAPLSATVLALVAATASAAIPQYTTPNTGPGPSSATLNGFTFVNKGLVGAGRIDSSLRDQLGDTFGSVSSMQITNWARTGDSYAGTFLTLPDRGRNDPANGEFYDYAGRIQTVPFTFTPYTGAAPLGGSTLAEKKALQNQIVPTYSSSQVFTYANPAAGGALTTTTGLNPTGPATAFGKPIPFAAFQTINGVNVDVNKLSLDAEGLVVLSDGSGFVSDEYGASVYRFNAQKQITGILDLPAAVRPANALNQPNFDSLAAPNRGRRNNQGLEGLAVSPDGTRLFAMMQSATVQDSTGGQQNRRNTRLFTYDLTAGLDSPALIAEHAVQLPTLSVNGVGGAVDRTAAQSEIVALGNDHLLVLARDSAGYGGPLTTPQIVKSVFLYDISEATNLLGNPAYDAANATIATAGNLKPGIVPADGTEVVNLLDLAQLNKFNFNLNSTAAFDSLTFSEKWEGMSLVPALDPANPNDYFLFLANDNDFNTLDGYMKIADGTFQQYSGNVNNDTVFLAYRVAIPEPASVAWMIPAAALLGRRRLPRR